LAGDLHVRLVDLPPVAHRMPAQSRSLSELRRESLDPPVDRDVVEPRRPAPPAVPRYLDRTGRSAGTTAPRGRSHLVGTRTRRTPSEAGWERGRSDGLARATSLPDQLRTANATEPRRVLAPFHNV
jgi:hypothetical protein